MSTASKCDRCGALYEQRRGDVTLEVYIIAPTAKEPRSMQSWSDVDFCSKCSKDVLAAIGSAIRR